MKIAIIGASNNPAKFGNKAVRAYLKKGFKVFPVNPKEKEIEGLPCFKTVLEIPEKISLASLYLPSKISIKLVEEFAKKGIKKIYLNPGAASNELIKKLKEKGIKPLLECSIKAIGENPENY
jgi:hypothetical protein